jgi:hypothetical protein
VPSIELGASSIVVEDLVFISGHRRHSTFPAPADLAWFIGGHLRVPGIMAHLLDLFPF